MGGDAVVIAWFSGDTDSGTVAAGQQSDHLVMAAAVQQWLGALRGPGGRKVGLLLCLTGNMC